MSGSSTQMSKKEICQQVARLNAVGLCQLYGLISHLPHSTNSQGYYFDLDNIPDDLIQTISAYLGECKNVMSEIIRGEQERVGLIYQFTKTMDTMQRRKKPIKKTGNVTSYNNESDEEDDCDFDLVDDGDDGDQIFTENDNDENIFHEKDAEDDIEDDIIMDDDDSTSSNLDALILKCHNKRVASRKNMKSAYFTPGWKGNDYREIDEFIRNEEKELSCGLTKRTTFKKTSACESKRGRGRCLPDVLEREEYSDGEI